MAPSVTFLVTPRPAPVPGPALKKAKGRVIPPPFAWPLIRRPALRVLRQHFDREDYTTWQVGDTTPSPFQYSPIWNFLFPFPVWGGRELLHLRVRHPYLLGNCAEPSSHFFYIILHRFVWECVGLFVFFRTFFCVYTRMYII